MTKYQNLDWTGAAWENDWRYLYNYDANNLLVTYYYTEWTGSLWENITRSDYVYNASNNVISVTTFGWFGTQWINTQRNIYTWTNGFQVNFITQLWNGSDWQNTSQGTFTYDKNNNRTVESYQTWDGAAWENYYRYLYNYVLLTGIENNSEILSDYKLHQNYPNPFNPSTKINFIIPTSVFVSLKVYDAIGNEVATLINSEKPAGSYEIIFDASSVTGGLSSGVYFYRITAGKFIETKKLLLMK
ncbi:MAG: T9SS C-terminal target domain-containing protein [Ignavibacteriales bacterium]|nr:MAG: T9SS C-terminal target domain-containing protein [Ignavibacteriales bacterium]